MKKDVIISFRTNQEIGQSLKKIAKADRQSISAVIGTAIYNHLKERKALQGLKREQRKYPRKPVSLPAFIMNEGADAQDFHIGKVLDLSLGGFQMSIPKGTKLEISTEAGSSAITIIFTLPEASRPISMKCQPHWVSESDNDILFGASIVDSDFQNYRSLQQHMM